MTDPTDRPTDPANSAPAAGRRRFLEQAAALVAVAPLAAALHAVAHVENAEAAAAAARKAKAAPKPAPPAADPFAASRPDLSICRTAEERATLEKQWKGLVDLVKVVRDAPLDPATEPVTVFSALPREA